MDRNHNLSQVPRIQIYFTDWNLISFKQRLQKLWFDKKEKKICPKYWNFSLFKFQFAANSICPDLNRLNLKFIQIIIIVLPLIWNFDLSEFQSFEFQICSNLSQLNLRFCGTKLRFVNIWIVSIFKFAKFQLVATQNV